MEEKFLYRSAMGQRWLSLSQIEEKIRSEPHLSHDIWKTGWSEWKNWRSVPYFSELNSQLPSNHFHYIGPTGRDYLSTNEIIANIRLAPQKHHRIWKKGWKEWKYWFEEETFQKQLGSLIPLSTAKAEISSPSPTVSESTNSRFGYDILKKITPSLTFVGKWNLLEDQWMILSQEDHSLILDDLQNSFPNLKWKENWIDDIICLFWTAILDCCFGEQNGNGKLQYALQQKDGFCLPNVCSFYPEDPLHRGGVLQIKTSNALQNYFSGKSSLPFFGDQSPFRNATIWSAIVRYQENTPLSRRRRLYWVLHQLSGYDIIRISQILALYERLLLTQLREKHVFELGDFGRLTLRKAKTRYHIGFIPSEELVSLVNSTIE